MSSSTELKDMLAQMAMDLDGPNGPGGGAVLLDAICHIEDIERRIRPAEPSSP